MQADGTRFLKRKQHARGRWPDEARLSRLVIKVGRYAQITLHRDVANAFLQALNNRVEAPSAEHEMPWCVGAIRKRDQGLRGSDQITCLSTTDFFVPASRFPTGMA